MPKRILRGLAVLLALILLSGCQLPEIPWPPELLQETAGSEQGAGDSGEITPDAIPAYDGRPYVALCGNVPDFDGETLEAESFESYAPLDEKGRTGPAEACVGKDLMPTEPRGPIGEIRPSGWHLVRDDSIDGHYLYNRCHLIGYQLSGENANERNLFTGTRACNLAMLPFENRVADYVRRTEHHVRYRVTPIFEGENLLASGIELEAQSVEDQRLSFHVYIYNVQPGFAIDYATGDSHRETPPVSAPSADPVQPEPEVYCPPPGTSYVLNTNTMCFHDPDCPSVQDIQPRNRLAWSGDRTTLMDQGYRPCGVCKP